MPAAGRRSLVLSSCGVLAAALWAGYALPLFVRPPEPRCGPGAGLHAGLLERLFPDVPPAWVLARLACLAAAALIVALVARRTKPPPPRPPAVAAPLPRLAWAALAVSAVQLVVGLWAAELTRVEQLLYVAGLAVPALLLLGARVPGGGRDHRGALLGSMAVALAWLLLRVPPAWHSPRTASAVDTLGAFTYLESMGTSGFNVLTDRAFKGVASLFFVLQGGGMLGPDLLPLTLPVLQAINVLWMALIAVGVGALAARLVAPLTAPVATAFFLFSPFGLLAPLGPIALFHGALLATGLLLLLLAIHDRRSPPAIAAFGALAGVGASHPTTLPITVVLCAAALCSAARRPRVPAPLALVAVLSFTAAVLPGLPSAAELQSMRQSYTFGRRAWRPLEHILLGQRSPLERPRYLDAGESGPLDIPLAALLTPFAIPRTPIRLWGDALYDPLGTGLAACGIAACALAARRSAAACGLLALLVIGLLPAFVSSTDRASLTRTCVAHPVLALLAAVGCETVRRGFAPTARPGWIAAAAVGIAVGGSVLFDVVNPRILPASATAIALEAVRSRPPREAVMLDHAGVEFGWLEIAAAVSEIPTPPMRVVPYAGAAALDAVSAGDGRLLFWSPGLEEQRHVAADVCARWPAARLFTLADRTGCSRVFAALVAGTDWRPSLPAERWSVRPCPPAAAPEVKT